MWASGTLSTEEPWDHESSGQNYSLEFRGGGGTFRQSAAEPAGGSEQRTEAEVTATLTAGPSGPGGPSTSIPCGIRGQRQGLRDKYPMPAFSSSFHLPRLSDRCNSRVPALRVLPSLPSAPGVHGQPEGNTHVTPSGAHEQPEHQDCPIPVQVFMPGPSETNRPCLKDSPALLENSCSQTSCACHKDLRAPLNTAGPQPRLSDTTRSLPWLLSLSETKALTFANSLLEDLTLFPMLPVTSGTLRTLRNHPSPHPYSSPSSNNLSGTMERLLFEGRQR